jgi:tetratricopeptide (TPR) repeat protein
MLTWAFLLALGSKQNAVMLPFALVLIEIVFFRPRLHGNLRIRLLLASAITTAVLIGVAIFLMVDEGTMSTLLKGYANRSFSPSERLLTQFRILVFYLFQIVYPNPANLSIEHDLVLSSGLFAPWTTFSAMLFILGLLWSTLFFMNRVPFLSFGTLFYLLNHVVESSIMPLEAIFEHRNYIPTMFLFTGVAAGAYRLLGWSKDRSRLIHGLLVCSAALMITFVGIGTYSRNADWRTEKSLWEDVIRKAPNRPRAYHNLAWGYYERIGDIETAQKLYQKAIHYQDARKQTAMKRMSATVYLNVGNIYYIKGEYENAIGYYKKCLARNQRNLKAHLRLIHSHISLSQWEAADAAVDNLLGLRDDLSAIFRLKGLVLMYQQRPEIALEWYRKANNIEGLYWRNLAGIGQALLLMGDYNRSDFFLKSAHAMATGELSLVLNRLNLYSRANQPEKAVAMAEAFLSVVPAGKVASVLAAESKSIEHYPIRPQEVIPIIKEVMHNTLDLHQDRLEWIAGRKHG